MNKNEVKYMSRGLAFAGCGVLLLLSGFTVWQVGAVCVTIIAYSVLTANEIE